MPKSASKLKLITVFVVSPSEKNFIFCIIFIVFYVILLCSEPLCSTARGAIQNIILWLLLWWRGKLILFCRTFYTYVCPSEKNSTELAKTISPE